MPLVVVPSSRGIANIKQQLSNLALIPPCWENCADQLTLLLEISIHLNMIWKYTSESM
jgi:hypothetical protein